MSLRFLDILKDIPPEYVGKYDIVHVRLLVQVVNQHGGDPRPALQNLLKLLSMFFLYLSGPDTVLITYRARRLLAMGRARR